ncbi:hypothetical protein NDU88_007897 [Pleurodeles waltl]|uniref:Uncharacterized protein n=1 Tax=Pleurodeles waltl TaxID=8319 RepID=A0AAV7QM68_PLEWA|nr:hypothetical protein NDU88_007897 [Pleurodeles waltl]
MPTAKAPTVSELGAQERAGKVRAEQWRGNGDTARVTVTLETQRPSPDLTRRDTALDECWNSPNGKNNDEDNYKNVPWGGAKRSNLYPVSSEYELEASGPASSRGIVNLEPVKMKTESPSGNNRATVVEIYQQSQPQIKAVQANESTDKGRVCYTA